ncbi:MAG: hypothetical protein HYZ88_02985 [Candidatus Omnitrophica bacterium]|nr:hypothetical protein [Candidatus Omnitrophota bacterium]
MLAIRNASGGTRGAVLISAIAVVVFLVTLGAASLLQSLQEDRIGQRSRARHEAFYLAEAAVEQAAFNLRTPTDVSDDLTTGALSTGTFAIDSPAESLGSQRWKATTHGFSVRDPNLPRSIEAVFELSPQSVFQFALFGDQAVTVSGSAITASYDSRLGAYGGTNVTHDGNVGTNATAPGGVTVSGSIFIDGQVDVGPDVMNPTSVVTGYNPAFITGGTSPPSDTQDVVSQPTSFPMPDYPPPEGMACPDLTIQGNTTTSLPPGTYCYHDLTIQGGGTLTTTGLSGVTVYLTGTLTAKGNSTVGVSSDPAKMVFLVSSTGGASLEQGTLTGSTTFYGALYAPKAAITITGNAEIFGSVVAKTINVSGSAAVHYDQAVPAALSSVSNRSAPTLISWREVN